MSRTAVGSVYLRKDGRWVASITQNGKRVSRYGVSMADARARLRDLTSEQARGTLTAPMRLTTGEWLERWLVLRRPELRPSSVNGYEAALYPFFPLIGRVRLDRLTPLHVAGAIAEMRREKRGTNRMLRCYLILVNALNTAVRLRMIPVNPALSIDPPRHQPKRQKYWQTAELSRFLEVAAVDPGRYAPLFTVLAATGVRISEALGLRWTDIDWQAGRIRVERALVFVGNTPSLQEPKSRDGRRTIILPIAGRTALLRLSRPLDEAAPVFTATNGASPYPNNLLRTLRALCLRADLPPITLHGLRHVNAAMLATAGVDPHTLRQHLGHSTIQMSRLRYAYAMRSDSVAAAAFDRAIATVEGGATISSQSNTPL